jgi:arsenate reductase
MKDSIIVYHNPRCSKSRCALDYLRNKGAQFTVVEYLIHPPTESDLKEVLSKLGIKPEELIRKSEEDYKSLFKGKQMTDEEWIEAMLKFPKLIERPIVIRNEKAVVARPTERIDDLF